VKRRNQLAKTVRGERGLRKKDEDEGNFFYQAVDISDSPERDHEDLILRRVPRPIAHRFRGAAGARALTHAQYLSALVSLHEIARRRADEGDEAMSTALQQLGLQTVTI
jgi:hypothetical protein